MYKTKQQFLLVLFFTVFSLGTILAQTVITGTVVDEKTKEPLPGSTVVVKETIMGTATDGNGKFSITLTKGLPVTLKVSNVGYESFEINVTAAGEQNISLKESPMLMSEITITGNRVEEKITKASVTVEKIGARQMLLSPAFDQYSALQNLKGVDLLSQSLTFKSVNLRGFGANNNNRFVQLVDGMDNRSPGFGFGFGSVAGVSDLDIESIEILPGASSALYGPDALQGLMLTKTKSPFDYEGLTGQVKVGVNNVGKDDFGAKLYSDIAIRYAHKFSDKFALKVNAQTINGSDFIADNYNDRMTRARAGFFKTDANAKTLTIGYVPDNDPSKNLQYDGVNIYGDDINNGGSFTFPATHPVAGLAGKVVTRTGYKEVDLTGDNGKIFSHRLNAALHYKINDKIEAIGSVNWGNGNLIRTAGFREYFPDYKRTQARLELKGDEFFVRAYNTAQKAEGFNMGNLAARTLTSWKTTAAWATEFSNAFNTNGGNISAARAAADAGKPAVGSTPFNEIRDKLANTLTTGTVSTANGNLGGTRLLDNSSMLHTEGMYNFKKFLPAALEVITGASLRKYSMETQGTIFPKTKTGEEFTITEYGAYMQGSYLIGSPEGISFKPIVAVRYDKNQYFNGGFTPRLSGVFSFGEHNFRASWQSAFRNPSANQLLADGQIGEVGGSEDAVKAANLFDNPAYTEASVLKFRTSNNVADLVKYVPNPSAFTTEKIKTWELGYKSLISNKLYIDAFFFKSDYKDFIATQNYIQPTNNTTDGLKTGTTSKTYQVNFNNFNEIFVTGYGIGLDYAIGNGWTVAANYAHQVGDITLRDNSNKVRPDAFGVDIVKRRMSDPAVSAVGRNFFISPENRYNITLANSKVTDKFGFSVAYRWTDEMWVEQGTTQGDIMLPSWNTFDAAVTYRIPTAKTLVKLGASNLLNKYYAQGYGLAQVGGMYYLSLTYGVN
jgi:iron complex outermembrane recepter protein